MQDEEIIRNEAREFFNWNIAIGVHMPIAEFHKIKNRLQDFYTNEYKVVFLDEIQKEIIKHLADHIKNAHQGEPKQGCEYEINVEKLLFYINQELETLPLLASQRARSNPEQKREKVFISYSNLDKEYLADIQSHFKPFLNKIDFWDDSKIQPGQKWKEEIRKAIHETKVAILLVSTDFLGSEFISTHELPPLLKAAEENGAVILIMILKPCLFEEFSELNQFQALNSASKPVIKMEYSEKEELLVNLVRQTMRILNELK